MKKILSAVSLSFVLSTQVFAAGSITDTRITQMKAYDDGVVLLAVEGTVSGSPACSTDTTYSFAIEGDATTGKEVMMDIIRDAFKKRSAVTLTGEGTCATFSTVETLSNITVKE